MIVLIANKRPVRILARKLGHYNNPVLATAIDFRFEDNPDCEVQRVVGINSSWVARHPLDPYYVVCIHGLISDTHATEHELDDYVRCGLLPDDYYCLPDSWWEWVLGVDRNGRCVKAPKSPRSGELTPDDVDEQLARA